MATNKIGRNTDVGDFVEIDGIDEIKQIERIQNPLGS